MNTVKLVSYGRQVGRDTLMNYENGIKTYTQEVFTKGVGKTFERKKVLISPKNPLYDAGLRAISIDKGFPKQTGKPNVAVWDKEGLLLSGFYEVKDLISKMKNGFKLP